LIWIRFELSGDEVREKAHFLRLIQRRVGGDSNKVVSFGRKYSIIDA
jgi:hypothetical protein